jgi:hypothetical protein
VDEYLAVREEWKELMRETMSRVREAEDE